MPESASWRLRHKSYKQHSKGEARLALLALHVSAGNTAAATIFTTTMYGIGSATFTAWLELARRDVLIACRTDAAAIFTYTRCWLNNASVMHLLIARNIRATAWVGCANTA